MSKDEFWETMLIVGDLILFFAIGVAIWFLLHCLWIKFMS